MNWKDDVNFAELAEQVDKKCIDAMNYKNDQ